MYYNESPTRIKKADAVAAAVPSRARTQCINFRLGSQLNFITAQRAHSRGLGTFPTRSYQLSYSPLVFPRLNISYILSPSRKLFSARFSLLYRGAPLPALILYIPRSARKFSGDNAGARAHIYSYIYVRMLCAPRGVVDSFSSSALYSQRPFTHSCAVAETRTRVCVCIIRKSLLSFNKP